ncbi:MAG: DUF5703 domain-containing protein [Pirellulales bacterium]
MGRHIVVFWVAVNATLSFAMGAERIPFDAASEQWLFDPEMIVSRNDVVYATPSSQPWEAMPTGGGDFSAMVRFDGDVHLHLTKSDAWGFQAPPDAVLGTRYFNNVSPGHIRITLGPKATELAKRFFRQRLDLYHGRILLQLGDPANGPRVEVWGHPTRKILIVEIDDPDALLSPAEIQLAQWRPTMNVGHAARTLHAGEIQTRPARPHLANTGMQDYFPADKDPLFGRGTAVVLGAVSLAPEKTVVTGQTATMYLPQRCPARYHLIIAAAATESGDPLAAANREFEQAAAIPIHTLRREHRSWWRDYWSQSFLRLESPDKKAQWLTAAYHVHLYTLGCVNRGPYPAKWDGGPGLMRGDERTWGLAEWVQEVRFTYMPLYAANRLEMAKGLTDHYTRMLPYLRAQTATMWGIPGLWIPETVLPWGHAEDLILKDDGRGTAGGHQFRWDPETARYGKFELYNPYVGFLLTAGLEICQHYLTYNRYSGDEDFLRNEAYPVIRGVCEFLAGLLKKEADGKYHLDPANALETWWMVRDPSDTLDGIRAIFPEFTRLAEAFDRDAALRARCAEILAALPEPNLGLWKPDASIDPTVDAYAPAAAFRNVPGLHNFENPALYRVYPFGLSGIGSPDHDRARRTFDHRIFVNNQGWSMDAIWAARLGLADEACDLLVAHAEKYNRFRYGGWDSGNSTVFPDGLAVAPYLDAGGVSAFALSEILLQSHNNLIRIAPALAKTWSGIFRLRAEGGFLVAADVQNGGARFVEITSLFGERCRLANPWKTECVVRDKKRTLVRTADSEVVFDTRAGGTYLIESAARPVAEMEPAVIDDEPNQNPGLPGRD